MRKYVKVLVESPNDKRAGNHSVKLYSCLISYDYKKERDGKLVVIHATRVFLYHGNIICYVDDDDRCFWLTHAGWFTSSTTCALNGYREYFESIGYKNMTG